MKRPALDASKVRFEQTVDVVVVGLGVAGASAVVAARQSGADVLAVERSGGFVHDVTYTEGGDNDDRGCASLLGDDALVTCAKHFAGDDILVNVSVATGIHFDGRCRRGTYARDLCGSGQLVRKDSALGRPRIPTLRDCFGRPPFGSH